MNEALQMSSREILPDLHNVTFSRALEDGLTHYGWLAGRMAEKCGQDRVHASHSVLPEKVEELTTRDTFGPLFGGLSPSADLQSCLESKLQARLDVNGSPEYALTWRRWDMLSGPPICALRASARRTGGRDCGGWPTPLVDNATGSEYTYGRGNHDRICLKLPGMAKLAGWATPKANERVRSQEFLRGRAPNPMEVAPIGYVPDGYSATTTRADAYRLNPRFSLWLMGYPVAWASCGERAMRLSRS